MGVEDGIEQIHQVAVFGVVTLKPVDELAACIPDRGGDEVEEVLAFVVDALECTVIGQPRDIDALGQLGLVCSEPFELGLARGDIRGEALLFAVGARCPVLVGAGLALGMLLVEAGQLRLRRPDRLVECLDRGVGDVLTGAFDKLEPGVVMIGVAVFDVLEGVFRGALTTEDGRGDRLRAQCEPAIPTQDAGAHMGMIQKFPHNTYGAK